MNKINRREFGRTISALTIVGLSNPVQAFQDRVISPEVLIDIANDMFPPYMAPVEISYNYLDLFKEITQKPTNIECYLDDNPNFVIYAESHVIRTESQMRDIVEKYSPIILKESAKIALHSVVVEIRNKGWFYSHVGLLRRCYYAEVYGTRLGIDDQGFCIV